MHVPRDRTEQMLVGGVPEFRLVWFRCDKSAHFVAISIILGYDSNVALKFFAFGSMQTFKCQL